MRSSVERSMAARLLLRNSALQWQLQLDRCTKWDGIQRYLGHSGIASRFNIQDTIFCRYGKRWLQTSRLCSVALYYDLTLHTGNRFGAGTDAQVFVKFFGENGDSAEIQLPTKKGDLERGMKNRYKIAVDDIGMLRRIQLRHDNTGMAPAWFLDKAVVRDNGGNLYSFNHGDWIKKSSLNTNPEVTLALSDKSQEELTAQRYGVLSHQQVLDDQHLKAAEEQVHENLTAVLKEVVRTSTENPQSSNDLAALEESHSPNGASNSGRTDNTSFTTLPLSPAVRFLVETFGLYEGKIPATGPKNRLLKGDVLKYMLENDIKEPVKLQSEVPRTKPATSSGTPPRKKEQPVKKVTKPTDTPNTAMRRTIAKRLVESKTTIPHLYSNTDCRLDALLKTRKELAKQGTVISMNDLIIKAAAFALRRVPEINVKLESEEVKLLEEVDVSVAVATDGGLITPIVRNADKLDVKTLSDIVKDLAKRAREGKLRPHEFQGGSFSISNLGMYGITSFSAVINPPQACIMAVGRTLPSVSSDGTISNMLNVTLSFDGRLIDEETSSKFLEAFKTCIESPGLFL